MSFDEFWKIYPKKSAKGRARKAYEKALKIADHETIVAGVHRYVEACPWRGDKQWCAHPATWLNDERWDDEDQTNGNPDDDKPNCAAGFNQQTTSKYALAAAIAGHAPGESPGYRERSKLETGLGASRIIEH